MNKQLKIAISLIIIIVTIGFGVFLFFNKNLNITNIPVPKEQSNPRCDANGNCLLTSVNIDGCGACDHADSSWQCLSLEERLEIREKEQEYMRNTPANEIPSCASCAPGESPLGFRCICENDECIKTSDCTTDNDCHSAYTGDSYKCIDNQCRYIDM